MHIYEVLRRPVVTEKSGQMSEQHNQYVFEVARGANKLLVKQAVERAFNVSVLEVNIMTVRPKMGHFGRRPVIKTPAWKKAVVTLAAGDRIEFFEGV
jgi:large subunit ribosomal protein L23